MTHTSDSMASSKKPIHLFLLLVTIFAAIGYTVAFKMGDENRTGGVFLVQFAPLVAAFITKLVFQRNIRGLGWGWGKTKLRKFKSTYLHALLAFMMVVLFSNDAVARVELTAEEVEAWAEKVFAAAFEEKQFSGAIVAVVQDGEIVMNKGYGYADYGDKTPVLPDATGFRIASVTKTFTATAIAQLLERGLIKSLNDPANLYLKRYQLPQNNGHDITIWDLLNHRAGFEEKAAGQATFEDLPHPVSEEYLENIMPNLVRDSDTWTVYDDLGTALSGIIIEDITGMSYADYIQENIFAPLGMKNTVVEDSVSPTPGLGKAYVTYENGTMEPVVHVGIAPFLAPIGGIDSTGSDMAQYMMAHLDQGRQQPEDNKEPILTTNSFETMHNTHVQNHPAMNGWGMTFKVSHWGEEKLVGHAGTAPGVNTQMTLMMDSNAGIFISVMGGKGEGSPLDNAENPDFEFKGTLDLERTLKEFFTEFAGAYHPREHIFAENMENQDLTKYAGSYLGNRRSFSTYEIISALGGRNVSIGIGSDGGLKFMDLEGIKNIAPGVFWLEEESIAFAFTEDDKGMHLVIDGSADYFTRVSGFDDPATVFPVAMVAAIILMTGFIAAFWPAKTSGAKLGRWLPVVAPLSLFGMIGFMALGFDHGIGMDYIILTGQTGRFVGVITLANLLAVIGALMVIITLKSWRSGYWGTGARATARRIHFTSIALAILSLLPALNLANLLGVNMP